MFRGANKKIAALTMVRNDSFFLEKWVSWYGAMLGKENLHIFFDGADQAVPGCTGGCHVEVLPRSEGNVRQSDRRRIDFLSDFAATLFGSYDYVIGSDVDEFLVADPALGMTLPELISSLDAGGRNSFSALGCDVTVNAAEEAPLDTSRPILEQRRFALISTRYTKASILCRPVNWGSGFHRTRKGNYHIVPGLYLLHFGSADRSFIEQKLQDADLGSRGWERHLHKRIRLIDSIPYITVRSWDKWIPLAVRLQTFVRRPYLWNKPAMLNLRILTELPERFRKLL